MVQGRGAEGQGRTLSTYRRVNRSIYDLSGRLMRVLVDGPKEPGYYSVSWHGRDEAGRAVRTGVYFYGLSTTKHGGQAGGLSAMKKLVVLRQPSAR